MLIDTLNERIIDMKTVHEMETASADTKKQAMADYNFKQLILNLKQMVDEVNLAVENSDFRPSANVISALKSFLGVCEKVVQTGVANNATTQYISFESKKLYTVIGQEWSEFYLKATANILSLCCMPYIIGTERGLEKRIILEESWKRFLIDNMVYIRGWIQMKKIKYLQDRNPGVPGIIYKLEPENEKHRKLQKIRGLWTAVIEMSDIYDIYSGSHIEQNEYEIDHFVPWSFVTNDEMWNLIPVNPSLNASKRDKLPNWDRYFLSFAQNQFRLNQMVYKYERLAHIFRECQRDNLNAAWSVEELYVKNIKNDQFCKVLESRLKPIYELARTQGYRIWMVGE